MKDLHVELKICEGCGALWLRAVSQGSYCRGCATWMSDCPVQRVGKRRGRKPRAVRAVVCVGGSR